ncbi:MAG: RNA polymerase sigma factor [Gammaproteobacteria bacterium]|nr:RNA polymerase sigma factor [Gammaproteobacteria bacterium]
MANLRRYAIALLRDRSLADDLVQDTLERAINKYSLFRQGSDVRAWLFTIMHNIFVNQLSRSRAWLSNIPPPETSAADGMAEEMLVARDFMQALHNLTAEQRAVILLVGLEQLSYEQTAQVLALPVGTVMSRLGRARERLRQLMEGDTGPSLRRVK